MNTSDRQPDKAGAKGDEAWRDDAILSIGMWLVASLVIGAVMWPMSKTPLACYLRSNDIDLIGIGGVAALFTFLFRFGYRVRTIGIGVLLMVLGTADYFHLGGSDIQQLLGSLGMIAFPLFVYAWLLDPWPFFDNFMAGVSPFSVVSAARFTLKQARL